MQCDKISIKYFIRSHLAFPADITEIKSAETDLKLEFAARIQIERRRFQQTAAHVTLDHTSLSKRQILIIDRHVPTAIW